jgi:energy-converting hydrogenase Eha subunit H
MNRTLRPLSAEWGQYGVIGELCLFGGAVMVLAFTALFQPTLRILDLARAVLLLVRNRCRMDCGRRRHCQCG